MERSPDCKSTGTGQGTGYQWAYLDSYAIQEEDESGNFELVCWGDRILGEALIIKYRSCHESEDDFDENDEGKGQVSAVKEEYQSISCVCPEIVREFKNCKQLNN